MSLEAISKIGFWLKVEAGLSFNPQAYSSMSRSGSHKVLIFPGTHQRGCLL